MEISKTLRRTLQACADSCRPARLLLLTTHSKLCRNGEFRRRTKILNPSPIGDYFSCRESEGLISFMPAGKTQRFTDEGHWERKGRQVISPVKWLRSMFSDRAIRWLRITEKEFACFSPAFKADEARNKITIRMSTFEEAYDSDNFASGYPSSCMWGCDVGAFYHNANARVVVAENASGQLVSRAILWDTAEPVKFMDRIYSCEEHHTHLMKHWAHENGYAHLERQSASNDGRLIMPDGTLKRVQLSVEMRRSPACFDFVPYLDTLRWGTGRVIKSSSGGHDCTLDSTEGGVTEVSEPYAYDVDGNEIDEDEIDYYRHVNGEYYHEDDDRIVMVDSIGDYRLRDRCVELIDETWELAGDCVYIKGHGYMRRDDDDVVMLHTGDYAHVEDAVEINGMTYHVDDDEVISDADGEYRLRCDCVLMPDGAYYTRDGGDIVDVDGEWVMAEDAEALRDSAIAAGGLV